MKQSESKMLLIKVSVIFHKCEQTFDKLILYLTYLYIIYTIELSYLFYLLFLGISYQITISIYYVSLYIIVLIYEVCKRRQSRYIIKFPLALHVKTPSIL